MMPKIIKSIHVKKSIIFVRQQYKSGKGEEVQVGIVLQKRDTFYMVLLALFTCIQIFPEDIERHS